MQGHFIRADPHIAFNKPDGRLEISAKVSEEFARALTARTPWREGS